MYFLFPAGLKKPLMSRVLQLLGGGQTKYLLQHITLQEHLLSFQLDVDIQLIKPAGLQVFVVTSASVAWICCGCYC